MEIQCKMPHFGEQKLGKQNIFGVFSDIPLLCERGQSGLTCFLVVIYFVLKMQLRETSQHAEE